MYNILQKKRNGNILSRAEIYKFVEGCVSGEIPDYQVSALLMAIYFQGMNVEETSHLTMAMAMSGESIDLCGFGNLSVDKHSTGGVGDKTSLIVAPVAAALGCKVAKMSGRGLGHTGGTVDKLESIPGYRVELTREEFLSQTEKTGIALTSQSGNLAPADKRIYAIRDVTATVESTPLIASSVMSKKIACGAKNIVLDVKMGSGAFMKDIESARELSRRMVDIGKSCGRNVRAVITDMDKPLGRAVGNSLEVIEAIELLQGKGDSNLLQLCCALAANMTAMAREIPDEEALDMAYDAIKSGRAYDVFCRWIEAQGGSLRYIENPDLFEKAAIEVDVIADNDGYIFSMDSEKIGSICVDLGGGRKTKTDSIDYAAGIVAEKRTGDFVKKGDVIAKLYTNKEKETERAAQGYKEAVKINAAKPKEAPIIYEMIK